MNKTKTEFIRRNFSFPIRAEKKQDDNNESKYTLYGLPIIYESKTNIGWFEEVIDKGALDNTDLKDVRFLVNHDSSKIPLARSRNNNANSTMRLKITDKGLEIEVDLDVKNNSEAKNLYSAINRGDISGMSFMFEIDGYEWEDLNSDNPTKHITKIARVYEVSAVTFPAYEETEIYARDKQALDNAKLELDNARSKAKEELDNSNKKSELELLKLKAKSKLIF